MDACTSCYNADVYYSMKFQLTVRAAPPDIGLHLLIAVFGANMTLGRQQKLDLLLSCS